MTFKLIGTEALPLASRFLVGKPSLAGRFIKHQNVPLAFARLALIYQQVGSGLAWELHLRGGDWNSYAT